MADIKEKLVELLWEYDQMRIMRMSIEECVDRLVPKGVTVQEWISVKDRLPEDIGDYLVVVKSKYAWETDYRVEVDVAGYNPYGAAYIDGCWNTSNDWDEGEEYLHITHWMPLPEPPKGE